MQTGDEKGRSACAYWRDRGYPESALTNETLLEHVWMHLGWQSASDLERKGSARIEDIVCGTFTNATNCTRH